MLHPSVRLHLLRSLLLRDQPHSTLPVRLIQHEVRPPPHPALRPVGRGPPGGIAEHFKHNQADLPAALSHPRPPGPHRPEGHHHEAGAVPPQAEGGGRLPGQPSGVHRRIPEQADQDGHICGRVG